MLEADDAVDLNELIRLDYCEHPVPRTDSR